MERQSFVFYSSFLRAIKAIKKRDIQAELALAIIEYGITGEITECGEMVDMAMELIKPQLDVNNIKYEAGRKGGSKNGVSNNPNGRRGSVATKELPKNYQGTTKELPKNYHRTTIELPNDNVNVNDNVDVDVDVNENEKKEIEKEKSVGDNPSLDDVKSYFAFNSHGGEEAERFWNYYESIGWMINGNPIVNWKLVAVRWLKDSRNVPCAIKQAKKKNEEKRVQISDTEDTYDYFGIEKRCPHNAPPRPDFEYGWYGGKWMTNAHYHGDF